jgi:hypothetical protein
MDPKGKGMVINDKEESLFNEPRDDKPTDSGSSHKKNGKKKRLRLKRKRLIKIILLIILASLTIRMPFTIYSSWKTPTL